jgi:hypothetical protein
LSVLAGPAAAAAAAADSTADPVFGVVRESEDAGGCYGNVADDNEALRDIDSDSDVTNEPGPAPESLAATAAKDFLNPPPGGQRSSPLASTAALLGEASPRPAQQQPFGAKQPSGQQSIPTANTAALLGESDPRPSKQTFGSMQPHVRSDPAGGGPRSSTFDPESLQQLPSPWISIGEKIAASMSATAAHGADSPQRAAVLGRFAGSLAGSLAAENPGASRVCLEKSAKPSAPTVTAARLGPIASVTMTWRAVRV